MRNLILTLFLLLGTAVSTAGVPATQLTETDAIRWDTSLSLPQLDGTPNIGIAGVFSGRIDGKLLIAGGANFPDRTPDANGEKRYHRDLYIYDASRCWQVIRDALPAPRAYGISVTLPEGVLCIGGCDAANCTDQVSLLTLDGDRPHFTPWPSLPRPLANAAGALVGHRVYVAGGIEQVEGASATRNFFVLDLHDRGRGWQELPSWPGPARAFAVAASQSDGFDNCFYLFSGRDFSGDSAWTVHKDGYRYNPRLGSWDRLEGEFPVMAGTAAPFGTNHILLIGGRSGTNSDDRLLRLYHTITETLTEIPVSDKIDLPVTTNVLPDDDGILITSGEIRPGVRTPVLLRGTLQSTVHRLTGLDIGVITLYFLSLALIGWYFSKNQKTSDDYFKGGGRIPWFIVGLSIFGTALSAITFMAIPAKAYATDWSYLLFNSGIVLAVPVIVLLFIPFYRRLNVTTAYEYLEARFNPLVRILCSIAFILFQIGRMGVVLLLPSIALNVVTGFDIFLCITLMGVLSLAYTLMGGIEAVAWTEALQVVVLLGAAVTVLIIVCLQLPEDLGTIVATASEAGKFNLGSTAFDLRQPTVWTVLIATFFTNITTYGTDQTIVQRYLTTATEHEARKGVYVNAALTIPATILFFLVGTALWAFYRHYPAELSMAVRDSDAILPWYISTQLPSGVLGLIIAGLFAAAMSTLSSSMNSAATAFVTDIYRKLSPAVHDGRALLRTARLSTLVLGIVGVGFALIMASWEIKSLWDEFSKILGILLGGLGGLFLLGLTTRRANTFGALCGIAASIVVQIIVARSGYVNLLLYSTTGFLSCFIVGYLASLCTPRSNRDIDSLTIYGKRKLRT
ncbi:sodium:solute symporter family transporter [Alistipes sp.]|uniref:sodium:solute symporter family transporter n=1 Tax=Alistipes sp. TaxID=1872444 RepID=UPI003AB460CF